MFDTSHLCWNEEMGNLKSVKGTPKHIKVIKIKPIMEIRDRKTNKTPCDKVNYQGQSGLTLPIVEDCVTQ